MSRLYLFDKKGDLKPATKAQLTKIKQEAKRARGKIERAWLRYLNGPDAKKE